jgi:hypothetical protein
MLNLFPRQKSLQTDLPLTSKLRFIILKHAGIGFKTSHHLYIQVLESTSGTFQCSLLSHYGVSQEIFSFSIDCCDPFELGSMSEISSSDDGSFFMSNDKTTIDVEDIKETVKNETIF